MNIFSLWCRAAICFAVGASLASAAPTAFAQPDKPVRMAVSNWAETQVLANMAKIVIEQDLKQPVELVTTDVGPQYLGIARGDLDVMLMGWLPLTHKAYYDKYKNDMVDLGVIFSGAKLGWAVPAYIPESELSSFDDLKKTEVKDRLHGTIEGIEPGAGLMIRSQAALKAYGLDNDYHIQSSSEAGMLSVLQRAIQQKQMIVITAWSPHWMFAKWPLRYLKDPKDAMGTGEYVHAFGSKSFPNKFPRVAAFIRHFKLPIEDIQAIELDALQSSPAAAAKKYLNAHPEKVKEWLKG